MSYTSGRRGNTRAPYNNNAKKDSLPPYVNIVGIISKYDPVMLKTKNFVADGPEASWVEVVLPYQVAEWEQFGIKPEFNERGVPTKTFKVQMPTPPDGKGSGRRNILELYAGKGTGEGLPKGSFVMFEKASVDPKTGIINALYSHGGTTVANRRAQLGAVIPDVYMCVQREQTEKDQSSDLVFKGQQMLLVADPYGTTIVTKTGDNFVEFDNGERRVFDMAAGESRIDAINTSIEASNTKGLEDWNRKKAELDEAQANQDEDEMEEIPELPPFVPTPLVEKNRANVLREAMTLAKTQDVPGKVTKISMNMDDAVAYTIAKTTYGTPGFQFHARSVVRVPETASEEEKKAALEREIVLAKDNDNRVAVQFSGWPRVRKDEKGTTVLDDQSKPVYDPLTPEQMVESFWNGKNCEVMKEIWENESEGFEFELVPTLCMKQGSMSLVPSNYTGNKGKPTDNSEKCRVFDIIGEGPRAKFYNWKESAPTEVLKDGEKLRPGEKAKRVKSVKKLLEMGIIEEIPVLELDDGRKVGPAAIGWVRGHVEIMRKPGDPASKFFGKYQQATSIRTPAVPLADIKTPFMPEAHKEAVDQVAKALVAIKASYKTQENKLKKAAVAAAAAAVATAAAEKAAAPGSNSAPATPAGKSVTSRAPDGSDAEDADEGYEGADNTP